MSKVDSIIDKILYRVTINLGEKYMNDIQKRLLDRNCIEIVNKVDRDMGLYVRDALTVLGLKDSHPLVTVYITSDGGDASVGFGIYDLLNFYPGQKIGIVQGMAGSMAATILQACDWRVALPNSEVLIHHIKGNGFPLIYLQDEEKLKKFNASRKSFLNQYDILAKRTGKTIEEIIQQCEEDESMSAVSALAYGLIDQIVVQASEITFPKAKISC